MKTSLKNLKEFVESDMNFSSSAAQHQAKDLLKNLLADFNKDESSETRSLRIRPMRSFYFLI